MRPSIVLIIIAITNTMAAGSGASDAYPFTLAAGSSDGKAWADSDFNSGHQILPEDDKRYIAWLFRLGSLLRDQFLPGPEHQGVNRIA